MLKYIAVLLAGYAVFKIIKNGAIVAFDRLKETKELDVPSDLIKCDICGSFVGKKIAIEYKNKSFCSEKCLSEYSKPS